MLLTILFSSLLNLNPAVSSNGVSLALSGGGARGLAQIGVLKALEERKIPVRAIAGTSIGAFVGALYSSGYSVAEIEKIFRETDWEDLLFNDRPDRSLLPFRRKSHVERYLFDFEMGFKNWDVSLPSGLNYGQKFSNFLNRVFFSVINVDNFKKLPIPFLAVASDLESGKPVILDRGNLAAAVRASAAYPGLFSPVEINQRILSDGGSSVNLPVDLARSLASAPVVAVDVSSPLYSRDRLGSLLKVTDQFVTMMMKKTTDEQVKKADIIVRPTLVTESTFEASDFNRIIEAGYWAMMEAIETQRLQSLSNERYQEWQQRRTATNFKSGPDLKKIEKETEKIYHSEELERVDVSIQKKADEYVVQYKKIKKSWGPQFLRFGVRWDGEIKGKQDGNAIINYRMTDLNSWAGEFQNEITLGTILELQTHFYQPVEPTKSFFISPHFRALRTDLNIYTGRNRTAEYELDYLAGGVDFGFTFLTSGELRSGVKRGFLNTEEEIGAAAVGKNDVQTSTFFSQIIFDKLDSAYFPTRGFYFSSKYVRSIKNWGADDSYKLLQGQFLFAIPIERLSLFSNFQFGTSLSSTLPYYEQFSVGGFRGLSGFREGELRGDHFTSMRSGFLFLISKKKNFFWDKFFVGGWFDAGNVWPELEDASWEHSRFGGTGSVGFINKLGAVSLAYGQSGQHNKQFYISVGRTFGLQDDINY